MLCLEAQRVRSHHSSVLHHGGRDGAQVLEDLSGLTGAQGADVSHDSVVGLGREVHRGQMSHLKVVDQELLPADML